MTLNIALRVALGSGIIFTKFDLWQLIRAWIIAFLCWYVMSRCGLDLWPVDLESSWYIKRHVIKVCTKFEQNRAILAWIIDNLAIFAHVVLRCNLDLWPFDLELLQQLGYHAFNLCTKFERNRIIHRWVIDNLARFRRAVLGVGDDWQTVSRDAWTQLHQIWWEHRTIIPTQEVCFSVRISYCIFKRERLNLSGVENDAKFRTFWPPLWKLGGVGEIPITIVEALPTIEPPKYIWWPSTARLLSAVDWQKKKEKERKRLTSGGLTRQYMSMRYRCSSSLVNPQNMTVSGTSFTKCKWKQVFWCR